jgi:hypothetical protein
MGAEELCLPRDGDEIEDNFMGKIPESRRNLRWIRVSGEWLLGFIRKRYGNRRSSPVDVETENHQGKRVTRVPLQDTKSF